MEERLQKILARAGFGSRRACEELIAAGRVRLNGQIAILGAKADPQQDKITVDGRPVVAEAELVYIALYKPRGVLSSAESSDVRPTVSDLVPLPERVYPVGRLDIDSEGLILLTNDGELTNRLTHPRYGHEKEYRVLIASRPDEEQLETWRRGVVLEDGYRTAPVQVRLAEPFGKGAWLTVIMQEGRKRQIRETARQLGLSVVRIIRVRIGTLQLSGLKPRQWRRLSEAEVTALKGQPGKIPARSTPRRATPAKPWSRPKEGQGGTGRRPRRGPERGR